MHLMYIITNVLFALQLNCDCYVRSMRKGQKIGCASNLMEKSIGIHFNHCGCCRTGASEAVDSSVITAVDAGLPRNLRI